MRSGRNVPPGIEAARKRFGSMLLANVRGVDVGAWHGQLLREGLAPQPVAHYLNALSGVFRHAERELRIELPAGNRVHKVTKPRVPAARNRRLRPGEFEALLAAAAENAALHAILVLAVETSMRMGELLALRREQVDLQRRIAHLPMTKNGASRMAALSSIAVSTLDAQPRRIDGRVSSWTRGDAFGPIWRRCRERARKTHIIERLSSELDAEGLDGSAQVRALVYKKRPPSPRTIGLFERIDQADPFLADLRFHDLCHEATSRLFEKGLRIKEVASMTGHESLAMLKRYTHIEVEKLAQKLG